MCILKINWIPSLHTYASADTGGGEGEGDGVRTPSGKSQVIWVYIGNKQLDPPGKSWTPSGTLKNDRFL